MKRRELLLSCAALVGSLPFASSVVGCGDDDSGSGAGGSSGNGGTGGSGGSSGMGGTGGTSGTGGTGGMGGTGGTSGTSGTGGTGGTSGTGGTGGTGGNVDDAGAGATCDAGANATNISNNHGHTFMTVPSQDIADGTPKQYHLVGPHMHDIDVTADHFAMLAAGMSVTIENSDAGHKHSVTLLCA